MAAVLVVEVEERQGIGSCSGRRVGARGLRLPPAAGLAAPVPRTCVRILEWRGGVRQIGWILGWGCVYQAVCGCPI